jgi:hypothetical protein
MSSNAVRQQRRSTATPFDNNTVQQQRLSTGNKEHSTGLPSSSKTFPFSATSSFPAAHHSIITLTSSSISPPTFFSSVW